jgi:DNA-directed RNA polymerase subunit M/transcription elongation factor TFIIS
MIEEETQRKAIEIIHSALRSKNPKVDKDWKLSLEIENAIFQQTKDVVEPFYSANFSKYYTSLRRRQYSRKVRSMAYNLRNWKRNPELYDKVVSRKISPSKLVSAAPDELFPSLWENHKQAAAERLRRIVSANRPQKKKGDSAENRGLYRCPKPSCRSWDTLFYYQLQLRSADEPMTNFYVCNKCGNQWKK